MEVNVNIKIINLNVFSFRMMYDKSKNKKNKWNLILNAFIIHNAII